MVYLCPLYFCTGESVGEWQSMICLLVNVAIESQASGRARVPNWQQAGARLLLLLLQYPYTQCCGLKQ